MMNTVWTRRTKKSTAALAKATTNDIEYTKGLGNVLSDLALTIQITSVAAFNSPGVVPSAVPCLCLNTGGTSSLNASLAINLTSSSITWHPFTANA